MARNCSDKSLNVDVWMEACLLCQRCYWMYLWGLPIRNDKMVIGGCYTGYKCILFTHHTHSERTVFWQWIRGCCLEALLDHNNISNPLSLVCTSVWCLSLRLNGSLWSEWKFLKLWIEKNLNNGSEIGASAVSWVENKEQYGFYLHITPLSTPTEYILSWFPEAETDKLLIRSSFILLFYFMSFCLCDDTGCDWFPLIQEPDSTSRGARDRRSCALSRCHDRPLGFTNDSDLYHIHTHTLQRNRSMHTEKVTSLRHQMPLWVTVFPSLDKSR